MSVLNFSLQESFRVYLVICCLIINVLVCSLATAILDYHIFLSLSTTFFIFLSFFFSVFSLASKLFVCLLYLSATNVILSLLPLIVNTFSIFYFFCTISTIYFFFIPSPDTFLPINVLQPLVSNKFEIVLHQ